MIVKHLSEALPETVGDFKRWYRSRNDGGHSLSIRYFEVRGIVPPHAHTIEDTVFYFERIGPAMVGQQEVWIKPGTMLVIPPGAMHSSIREARNPSAI